MIKNIIFRLDPDDEYPETPVDPPQPTTTQFPYELG